MSLFYYSLSQKKFAPLFPHSVSTEELREVNRYKTGTKGVVAEALAWLGGKAMVVVLLPILGLAKLIFWAAGLFVGIAGSLLDQGIKMTIDSTTYSALQVIEVGWTTIRDFSNMLFIFALLYIAIKTILGLAGSSTKRWVANLIIAALLINFSLFATKVVIDAGNVLAMGFWEKMQVNGAGEPSAAENLMQGLKLQTSFDVKDKNGNFVETDMGKEIMIYLGGTLVMLVAGYVFLAGAIMMIARTVTLIFLMIASPFAFLSFALPIGGGFANKWLSKLIGNAFVAPAFLAMIYLDIIIINGLDLQKLAQAGDTKFGGIFSGELTSFPIIYNFLMVIMFMLAALTVASAVSSGAGEMGSRWSKRLIGYGAVGGLAGVAMAGRQIGGRVGKMTTESKKLKEMAGGNSRVGRFVGNLGLASGEKMKKGTWDARNVTVAGKGINSALGLGGISAGQGGKKTYDTHGGRLVGATLAVGGTMGSKIPGVRDIIEQNDTLKKGAEILTSDYQGTEREEKLIKIAKSRYPSDPAAQRAYLLDHGVTLEAPRNKDVRTELARADISQAHKNTIKDRTAEYAKAIKDAEDGGAGLKKILTEGKDAGKEIGEVIASEIAKSLQALNGKEVSDLLTQEQLTMKPVIAALQSQHLSTLNAKGSELNPDTIAAINAGVAEYGNVSGRSYMKSQANMGGPLKYNAEENLTALTADYNKQKASLGENSPEFKAYADSQKKEFARAIGMSGGAEALKEMSHTILTHEAVVREYNGNIVKELTKKINERYGEDDDVSKKLQEQIALHSKHGKSTPPPSAKDTAAERSAPKAKVVVPQQNTATEPPMNLV